MVQFILLNISAAFHAGKFSRFYKSGSVSTTPPSQNIFKKTWRLFAGQRYYKAAVTEIPILAYDTVTLTTVSGLKIEGWYMPADSGAKGTVILFHGLTMNKTMVLPEANDFHYQGYHVLLVDFRAHGNSEGKNSYIGLREAEEVKLAFDFIVTKGEKNIFCWGISMGSVAIIKAVADYGIKPSGVILEMPFASLQSHLGARARTIGFGGFPEKPFAFLVTWWMGVERGYNGFGFQTAKYARQLQCPVLMTWGELDYLVLKWETDKVYNAIASQKKKLIIFSQASHESFLQKDPAKWRTEVEQFLTANRQ